MGPHLLLGRLGLELAVGLGTAPVGPAALVGLALQLRERVAGAQRRLVFGVPLVRDRVVVGVAAGARRDHLPLQRVDVPVAVAVERLPSLFARGPDLAPVRLAVAVAVRGSRLQAQRDLEGVGHAVAIEVGVRARTGLHQAIPRGALGVGGAGVVLLSQLVLVAGRQNQQGNRQCLEEGGWAHPRAVYRSALGEAATR